MNSKLNGILIASDIDGTIIGKDFSIPKRNLKAIEELKANGGFFCLASGRPLVTAKRYALETKVNAPCLFINGGIIYDFQTEKIIWGKPLESKYIEYAKIIKDTFPHIGVEAIGADKIIPIVMNEHIERHMEYEKFKCELKDIDEITDDIYKFLFIVEKSEMSKLNEFVDSMQYDGVKFVASSENFFEMIPSDISKGKALEKLTEILKINKDKVYAVGDYFNDIEMLSFAKIGAATENAPDEVKKFADIVVCSCENGAVADLVDYISNNE